MIAFAGIAHRIVGKPVETVIRSAANRSTIPPDIAAIVSSKYTFSVAMAEESFRKEKKSYQLNGIITAYVPSMAHLKQGLLRRRVQLTEKSTEQDESCYSPDSQMEIQKDSEITSNLESTNLLPPTTPLPTKTKNSKNLRTLKK
ncbi:hypothetical protein GQ55_2G215800 [Panicum hallii var. hallii]|uniref:Uncharacterized protein n=1 Tax=Panicum hallii var. hallii TaxID=1504633 RepID=A0A2T7ER30_9POAL|nr:hypothetical protein GQ55_2G215800 [Panicum hallii var. hallii]